jgi:hypothetical protein
MCTNGCLPEIALSRPRLRAAMEDVITTLFTDCDLSADLRMPRVP